MKAITLTQPWASLVSEGAKRFETRSWSTRYRGPLAIHAAAGFPPGARALCAVAPFHLPLLGITLAPARDLERWPQTVLPLGALIGITWLEDVTPVEDVRELLDDDELAFGDYSDGRYAWKLREPESFAPVTVRGHLGLWNVDDELIPERYRLAIRHPGR